MKQEDYKAILNIIVQNIGEGVYVVNSDKKSIIYNDRMSKLEKMKAEDVLGKDVRVVQSYIPEEESTLIKALRYKETTPDYCQTFVNQYGKEITTINTTIPVLNDRDQVIAAVEIARDVTDIKNMSNTILDLRNEVYHSSKITGRNGYTFENMIGASEGYKEMLDKSKKASKVNVSVLIYGETGTGKELVAQSIHYESSRQNKPFIAQNCAALPESLMEGILFGTAKGGFTGAIDREGLFEQANGGTLLLDEISTMPYDLQSKLLRVLQENYIRRVGGTKDIPIDVRIIATINERAEDLIAGGRLRQDLYYRLKIIEINIPPLRERRDDIIPLSFYFLNKYNIEFFKHFKGFSRGGKEVLLSHDYPGNVRELQHILMSAISMAEDGDLISEEHLELPVKSKIENKIVTATALGNQGLEKYMDNIERELILEAVENSGRHLSKAARQLGLKRQTLHYKLKKFGIEL